MKTEFIHSVFNSVVIFFISPVKKDKVASKEHGEAFFADGDGVPMEKINFMSNLLERSFMHMIKK